ncbi:unnamed protein product [Hymenolepis diminuta]|uniref:Uncharacterized protein n=1 Tax=Hymenolepis diminuta TaxID=6216 RepID=A0A3P6ZHU2_HYMDI|nr:unnamed protein product [Hymenolepis diminuta]
MYLSPIMPPIATLVQLSLILTPCLRICPNLRHYRVLLQKENGLYFFRAKSRNVLVSITEFQLNQSWSFVLINRHWRIANSKSPRKSVQPNLFLTQMGQIPLYAPVLKLLGITFISVLVDLCKECLILVDLDSKCSKVIPPLNCSIFNTSSRYSPLIGYQKLLRPKMSLGFLLLTLRSFAIVQISLLFTLYLISIVWMINLHRTLHVGVQVRV